MNNKKIVKKIISILGIFVIIIVIICIYLNQTEVREDKDADIFKSIVSMNSGCNNSDALYIIVNDEQCLEHIADRIYFGTIEHKYLQYTKYDKLLGRVGDTQFADSVSEFISISTTDVVRTINISDIACSCKKIDESVDNELLYYGGHLTHYGVNWNGENCIIISSEYRSLINKELITKYIIYDFDGEKVKKIYETNILGDMNAYQGIVLDNKVNTSEEKSQALLVYEEYLNSNGLNNIKALGGLLDGEPNGDPIFIKISDLPQNNHSLYEEFPDLEVAKKDDSMQDYFVILVFPYSVNADEIVKMLTEEGHEVSYEGVYVNENLTVDGEGHYINSFDEFMKYRKVKEKISIEKYEQ